MGKERNSLHSQIPSYGGGFFYMFCMHLLVQIYIFVKEIGTNFHNWRKSYGERVQNGDDCEKVWQEQKTTWSWTLRLHSTTTFWNSALQPHHASTSLDDHNLTGLQKSWRQELWSGGWPAWRLPEAGATSICALKGNWKLLKSWPEYEREITVVCCSVRMDRNAENVIDNPFLWFVDVSRSKVEAWLCRLCWDSPIIM